MLVKKIRLITLVVFMLNGCGGGGSSSGGGAVVEVPFPTGKFSGTYQTTLYSGTIEVTINSPSNVVIAMTGISCLPSQFSDGLGARVDESILAIGGDINGLPLTTIALPPNININVPINGGSGSIDVAPPAPCVSQAQGSITLE